MEIASLKLQNHPILHDLELNFCDENGKPYKNIVFAGENGTGKTTLLELINNIVGNMKSFIIGGITCNITIEFYLTYHEQIEVSRILNEDGIGHKKLVFRFVPSESGTEAGKYFYTFSKEEKQGVLGHKIEDFFRALYMSAEMSFKTKKITTITSKGLDSVSHIPKRTNDEKASDLKQLFVDLPAKDAEDLQQWVLENPDVPPSADVIHKNTSRFSKAYNSMLGNITFRGAKTQKDERQVIFEKYGKIIYLEELSSGEKQIVFRGGELLKDKELLDGSVILIDEPEISMHPRWQSKIFSYYSDLFKTETEQKSQIFFATHSEHVVKDAMDKEAKIIVFTEIDEKTQQHTVNNKSVLSYGPTYAEIKYFAFNIPTIEFHDELYGLIQEKNNCEKENQMEDFLKKNGIKQDKTWARLKDGVFFDPEPRTLMTYIRNFYHHPEASKNEGNPLHPLELSDEEMRQSIDCMISILRG